MNAKDLIILNNEKREQLTASNLEYYEEMLVYIRLSSNKSEQQTEEILIELLDHLLEAQQNKRTAEEVFGRDPKAFCDEIIGEIPQEQTKKSVLFFIYIAVKFLAIGSLTYGLLSYGMYHLFDLGTNIFAFSLGSAIVIVAIELLLMYGFIRLIFAWLKYTSFRKKQLKKWVEFIQIWIICTLFIGAFILLPTIIPSFGKNISVPVLSLAILGAVLYIISFMWNKKQRLTA
ncbi:MULTISPECIES: DUF1129 family protein [unclassified Virgibacillus]|uniref:DUF1129 family protein n=1 Tax=unclassified Virgibacillus TaxID=2620237 RepID=UPI0024DE2108|nr:DUF1129 family protein [Virgibacillus sp. LDC-1]